ncbi:hypothetical protein [Streptomyces sp. NPDC056160]|uniref:hypothetical protein n=1 Tax=Streptomyces sp. NPDC056160 TaxID=3345731 RepID=UPI0035DC7A48
MWLDDPQALEVAQTFLVQLTAHSEALNPDSDLFQPELPTMDFDNEAFAEYLSHARWSGVGGWSLVPPPVNHRVRTISAAARRRAGFFPYTSVSESRTISSK